MVYMALTLHKIKSKYLKKYRHCSINRGTVVECDSRLKRVNAIYRCTATVWTGKNCSRWCDLAAHRSDDLCKSRLIN